MLIQQNRRHNERVCYICKLERILNENHLHPDHFCVVKSVNMPNGNFMCVTRPKHRNLNRIKQSRVQRNQYWKKQKRMEPSNPYTRQQIRADAKLRTQRLQEHNERQQKLIWQLHCDLQNAYD